MVDIHFGVNETTRLIAIHWKQNKQTNKQKQKQKQKTKTKQTKQNKKKPMVCCNNPHLGGRVTKMTLADNG